MSLGVPTPPAIGRCQVTVICSTCSGSYLAGSWTSKFDGNFPTTTSQGLLFLSVTPTPCVAQRAPLLSSIRTRPASLTVHFNQTVLPCPACNRNHCGSLSQGQVFLECRVRVHWTLRCAPVACVELIGFEPRGRSIQSCAPGRGRVQQRRHGCARSSRVSQSPRCSRPLPIPSKAVLLLTPLRRITEEVLQESVDARTESLISLRELGPPDLVHLLKQPTRNAKHVCSQHPSLVNREMVQWLTAS